MVDISVVMDKLHSFKTVEDLAEFFRGYSIKAIPRKARECIITKFIMEETGLEKVATGHATIIIILDEGSIQIKNTEVMCQFIEWYDSFGYPDLIEEEYKVKLGDRLIT